MFKFARNREVLWPVVIEEPLGDGSGKLKNITIHVKYELLTENEIECVLDKNLTVKDASAFAKEKLREKVKGWDGIEDSGTGEPVAFTQENLDALLMVSYIRRAFDAGLWECSQGIERKNS